MRWLALFICCLPAAGITVEEILERGSATLTGVEDFTCLMTFTVRSEDMRVPETRVKIHFKQPNKVKPVAVDNDFAVLPETYHMALGNILRSLTERARTQLLREDSLAGRGVWVLKVTPTDDTPALYSLVYVDRERYTVNRIVSYPRGDKPLTLSLAYRAWRKAWLPSETTIDAWQRRRGDDGAEPTRVQIKLWFRDYKVNVGLPDSLFADAGGR